ncbi:PTK7 protein tyrosine kinase 7 [Anopheles darlingi]|uniref:Tyrosine-protein kinase-like otk n=1 Tax=Anopheles darlingi TaxID=43151 RepID=W5JPQ3_ANODA|nr:PTK7 protein tyrosine kinase 7 [Anopheles darlingi]
MPVPKEDVRISFAVPDTVRCEFQFTVTPQSRQVYEGEPVAFECRALFDDEIDFSWTLNGVPLSVQEQQPQSQRAARPPRLYQNGSNLHIRAVNGTLDRGDYVCLATARASGARVASPPARLDHVLAVTAGPGMSAASVPDRVYDGLTDEGCTGRGLQTDYGTYICYPNLECRSASSWSVYENPFVTPGTKEKGTGSGRTARRSPNSANGAQQLYLTFSVLRRWGRDESENALYIARREDAILALVGIHQHARNVDAKVDTMVTILSGDEVLINLKASNRFARHIPGRMLQILASVRPSLDPLSAIGIRSPGRWKPKSKYSRHPLFLQEFPLVNPAKKRAEQKEYEEGHLPVDARRKSQTSRERPVFSTLRKEVLSPVGLRYKIQPEVPQMGQINTESVPVIPAAATDGRKSFEEGCTAADPVVAKSHQPIAPPVVQLLKHDADRGSITLKCHSANLLEGTAADGRPLTAATAGVGAAGDDEVHAEWYRNEMKLTKSAHIEVQRRKLHIRNVSSKDNGIYSCILVITSRHTEPGHRITLRSVKNYRLKLKPGALYGNTTSLPIAITDFSNSTLMQLHQCDTGEGNGKIDCSKNRNLLLCRGKRGDRQLSGATTIEDLAWASNLPQADEPQPAAPAQLQQAAANSAAPVRIVLHPVTTVVNESQSAIFNCGFRALSNESGAGAGGFVVRWRKDGKVIRKWDTAGDGGSALTTIGSVDESFGATESSSSSSGSSSMFRDDARIHVDRTNGSLVFSSVVASDEGSYDCQITNNATEFLVSSTAAELQIISNLRFTPKPPTTKNLELGSIAKIHCKAQGTPTPTVHWTVEGNRSGGGGASADPGKAGSTNPLPETVEDVNGTLVFRAVTADHRGNYVCVASNSQGEIRASVAVNVVVAPKFVTAPEGTVQVSELGTVQFHCVATGDPKPTIQWDKDLQYLHSAAGQTTGSGSSNSSSSSSSEIPEERVRVLANGTLVLTEVHLDDEGRYGCTIGNSAGLKREEVHLIVRPSDGMALPEESAEDGFLITRAVLITMSVAFAYIILVVGLMIWCRHRRAARKARLDLGSKENGDAVDMRNCEIEPCLPEKSGSSPGRTKKLKNGSAGGGGGAAGKDGNTDKDGGQDKSDDTVNSNKSKKSSGSGSGALLEQLTVPRTAIVEMLQIGKCDFGDVFIGKIRENDCRLPAPRKDAGPQEPVTGDEVGVAPSTETGNGGVGAVDELVTENERSRRPSNGELNAIRPENDYKPVMVKALTKVKDEHCCQEFRRQLELFRTVAHRNVVQVFGLCRDKDPHYLLLEYTDWGDLKQFLLATSPKTTPPNGTVEKVASGTQAAKPPPLNVPQILALAHQIGRGMDAIYKARIIHKDLATRNCIISSDFSAKISMPALARDKYSREYCRHRNQLMPVRWLAPECFHEDDWSIKSDVYAFAVLVWELFTNATELPFKELTDEEVISSAAQPGKLERQVADGTPEALHKILTTCWSTNPKERPSFSQLVVAIGNCLQSEYPKEPAE